MDKLMQAAKQMAFDAALRKEKHHDDFRVWYRLFQLFSLTRISMTKFALESLLCQIRFTVLI